MRNHFFHDCTACTFIGHLGPTEQHPKGMDLYTCPQGGNRTIVGRYSSIPREYMSGHIVFIDTPQGRVRMEFEKEA